MFSCLYCLIAISLRIPGEAALRSASERSLTVMGDFLCINPLVNCCIPLPDLCLFLSKALLSSLVLKLVPCLFTKKEDADKSLMVEAIWK